MKEDPRLHRIRENMEPGVISLTGFLGTDSRAIEEILEEDDATVKRLGLTHEKIADALEALTDEGRRGLGEFIRVRDQWEVRVDDVRGKMPCPFGEPGMHPKTTIIIENCETEEDLELSNLMIHMIRDHGFYEGKGSPWRLNPEKIARVLKMT